MEITMEESGKRGSLSGVSPAEDELNLFYQGKFGNFESSLSTLQLKIDEEFYDQEKKMAGLIGAFGAQKNAFLKKLEEVENSYDRLIESNKQVFEQIQRSKNEIGSFQIAKKQFDVFYQNLKALETELGKGKL